MLEVLAIVLYSQQPIMSVEEGVASYYTVASSSLLTASGEKLDDGGFTCAMLEGEFGGYYRVTAENGRSVVCRLNDRGPYVKGRIVDLSEAAMRALHPTAGLLRVTVERIPERDLPPWLWSGG